MEFSMRYYRLRKMLSVVLLFSTGLGGDPILAMEEAGQEGQGTITRFREFYFSGARDKGKSEVEEVNRRLPLIIQAFQGIGLTPEYALDDGCNDVEVCVSLPENFVKFVSLEGQVPRTGSMNHMVGMKNKAKNCDFKNTFNYWNSDVFQKEHISSGHCSFSVPNISLHLWAHKSESGEENILVSPEKAVFHITIFRKEYLKDGLKDFVTKEMKEGIYVVVPEGVQQVDWHKTPQIMDEFIKENSRYRYEWKRGDNNHFDAVSLLIGDNTLQSGV